MMFTTALLVLALGGSNEKATRGQGVAKIIMKYRHANYELWWQKRSDSSAEILANACESVLRNCTVLVRQTFLGLRKLLTLGGWLSRVHTARRRVRRNSLLR
jgi:hypothetical protein